MSEPGDPALRRGDHLSVEGRSRVMAAIRSKDTKPELRLRAALRAVGATGYRLHRKELPGRPDLAFTRWRVAVFVDGAFWHGHPEHFNPETASDYWRTKMERNQARDRQADESLSVSGWTVLRFWDFQVQDEIETVVATVLSALRRSGWNGSPNAQRD
jgi:DNA mismatch endonuclease, patch repair protein